LLINSLRSLYVVILLNFQLPVFKDQAVHES